MNKNFFIILTVGSILQCMYDIFITNRISEREARKAQYNCDICKNWKCYYKYCQNQKQKK